MKSRKAVKRVVILVNVVIFLVAAFFAQQSVEAKEAAAANPKLAMCFGCHGKDGKAINPLWPNLACQNEDYLVTQLRAFKNKERPGPSMYPIIQTLNDQDFKDAAAYYSGLESCQPQAKKLAH